VGTFFLKKKFPAKIPLGKKSGVFIIINTTSSSLVAFEFPCRGSWIRKFKNSNIQKDSSKIQISINSNIQILALISNRQQMVVLKNTDYVQGH